jgi:aminoglycoside phosphotransferase (APT) family kinase protein
MTVHDPAAAPAAAPSADPAAEATAGLDAELVEWIRTAVRAQEVTLERRSAGASRAGYFVDASLNDGLVLKLWLRMDTGAGPQSGGTYTLRREAAVYRELQGRGVKIATVVAVHPTREAFLMGRLEGRNWFSEITDPQQQETLATAFMAQLAQVHRIDPHSLDLPELGTPSSIGVHVLEEIEIWDAQYRQQQLDDPLIEVALSWLRRNLPADADWPLVLVQGDTGPGNFMYQGDQLVAVTDWEMAHYGDLHDDLAWIYVRDVQERFTDLRERLHDYETFFGRRVDPQRLRYFLVLAQTRCAIGTRNGLLAHDARGEMASHLIYSALHLRLLAEALADAAGVDTVTPEPNIDAPDTPTAWAYDVALDDLRDHVLPALDDTFAVRRAKGMARILKYLREQERVGSTVDRLDLAGLGAVLGHEVNAVLGHEVNAVLGHEVNAVQAGRSELCKAIVAGEVDDAAVITFSLAYEARRTYVLRFAMGALARRHLSPLPD